MSRKGVFIPDITVEMFRKATLESVEEFMVSGQMEDIEIPERPHGEWIDTDVTYEDTGDVERRCSNCKHGDRQSPSAIVPYCWYCGADMRKRGEAE